MSQTLEPIGFCEEIFPTAQGGAGAPECLRKVRPEGHCKSLGTEGWSKKKKEKRKTKPKASHWKWASKRKFQNTQKSTDEKQPTKAIHGIFILRLNWFCWTVWQKIKITTYRMLKATNKNNTHFHKHASSGNIFGDKNMQNYKRTERKNTNWKSWK